MDVKGGEAKIDMNIIRFMQPQSRHCSVKLAAHGQLGEKKVFFLKQEKVDQAVE